MNWRITMMRGASAAILLLLVMMANGETEVAPNTVQQPPVALEVRGDTAGIRFVYMTPPIPSSPATPLFPDHDQERIVQLLAWLNEAKTVPQGTKTDPLWGRSTEINIAYEDGKTIHIRPAWTCTSEKGEKGDTSISCRPVKDRIWMQKDGEAAKFAESSSLFAFVTRGYTRWMPRVEPFKLNSSLVPGESLTISGQGWLSQRVRVEVRYGSELIASGETMVDHGAFQLKLDMPQTFRDGSDENREEVRVELEGIPYPHMAVGSQRYGFEIPIKAGTIKRGAD